MWSKKKMKKVIPECGFGFYFKHLNNRGFKSSVKINKSKLSFRLQPHFKIEPMCMTRDGNGVELKDGVFAPVSHSFDLPYSRLALHERKNFLTPFPSLGTPQIPPNSIKLYILLICPQLLQYFLIKLFH